MIKSLHKNSILVTLPKLFIVFIVLAITLPILGIIFGFELGGSTWAHTSTIVYHALYYWSISIIASIIVLLAFTHYYLTVDDVSLGIGTAYLFAAFFNIIFTLSNDWMHSMDNRVENLHAYAWVFSNTFTGLLLVMSLKICLLKNSAQKRLAYILLFLFNIFIMASSYWLIFSLPQMKNVAQIIYPESITKQPLGIITLCLYLYLSFSIYPQLFRNNPSTLTDSVFYISLTQISMSCYMIFYSITIFDTAYLGALLIQIISYLIPFSALILGYFGSYRVALEAQKELLKQKEKFEQLSTHDPLTQLLNRRALEETTNKMISRSKRYCSKFTFIYLDLDNFKEINDSIGHDVGDELIKQVSTRLQKSIRASDYCARLGGDEFGIILSETNSIHDISNITKKLINVLNEPFFIKNKYLYSGVSIGIAVYPEAGDTYNVLLKNADTAMYQAKKTGKNKYSFYTRGNVIN